MLTEDKAMMTISERTDLAKRFAAALEADYSYATTRVWAQGEHVRVYVSDPRDKGHVAILANGTVEDHTRGLSSLVARVRASVGVLKTIAGTDVVMA